MKLYLPPINYAQILQKWFENHSVHRVSRNNGGHVNCLAKITRVSPPRRSPRAINVYRSFGFVLALLITGLAFVRHVKTSRNAFNERKKKETKKKCVCVVFRLPRARHADAGIKTSLQPRATRNRQLPEKHFLNELRAPTFSSSAPATYPH